MEPFVRYGLSAALISVIAKMLYFFFLAPDDDWDMYVRFGYLLIMLVALYAGIVFWKKTVPGSSFTDDVKQGMKVTSVYALVVSLFTWIYYKWVDPAYFAQRIQQSVAAAPADQVANAKSNAEIIFSPLTQANLTLFAIIVIGFFYTLSLVLIVRMRSDVFVRKAS